MEGGREEQVAVPEEGSKENGVNVAEGSTMGRNMLTDSRSHGCIGVTENKEREPRIKVRTNVTEAFPPGFALGNSHLFVVPTGSFGLAVGGMKIEEIDKPGTKLNTDE